MFAACGDVAWVGAGGGDAAAAGERVRFTFSVTAPSELATAKLGASVTINGVRFNHQRVELRYDHIPFQLLQLEAQPQLSAPLLRIRILATLAKGEKRE